MTTAADILGRAPIMRPVDRAEDLSAIPPFSELCAPLSATVKVRRSYANSNGGLIAFECGDSLQHDVRLSAVKV